MEEIIVFLRGLVAMSLYRSSDIVVEMFEEPCDAGYSITLNDHSLIVLDGVSQVDDRPYIYYDSVFLPEERTPMIVHGDLYYMDSMLSTNRHPDSVFSFNKFYVYNDDIGVYRFRSQLVKFLGDRKFNYARISLVKCNDVTPYDILRIKSDNIVESTMRGGNYRYEEEY